MQGLPFQRSENHHLQGTRKKVSLDRFFHAGRFFSCFADHAAQGLEQTSMVRFDSQVKNQRRRNFETACSAEQEVLEESWTKPKVLAKVPITRCSMLINKYYEVISPVREKVSDFPLVFPLKLAKPSRGSSAPNRRSIFWSCARSCHLRIASRRRNP